MHNRKRRIKLKPEKYELFSDLVKKINITIIPEFYNVNFHYPRHGNYYSSRVGYATIIVGLSYKSRCMVTLQVTYLHVVCGRWTVAMTLPMSLQVPLYVP